MHDELTLHQVKAEWHGTARAYVIGLVSSLVLTGLSFALVVAELLPRHIAIYALVALAIVQAIVQLRFFLHLGQEPKPRWESLIFWFMVLILLIIAFGSLWIMHDLNTRMMMGAIP